MEIRSVEEKTKLIPSTMTLNGQNVCDTPLICELFAHFFKNVYVVDSCEKLSNEYSTSAFRRLEHVCFAEHNILEALIKYQLFCCISVSTQFVCTSHLHL